MIWQPPKSMYCENIATTSISYDIISNLVDSSHLFWIPEFELEKH